MYSSFSREARAEHPSLGLKKAFAQALPDQGVTVFAPGSTWVLEPRLSCPMSHHPANPPATWRGNLGSEVRAQLGVTAVVHGGVMRQLASQCPGMVGCSGWSRMGMLGEVKNAKIKKPKQLFKKENPHLPKGERKDGEKLFVNNKE